MNRRLKLTRSGDRAELVYIIACSYRANVERVWKQHLRGGVFTSIEPLVRKHIVSELGRSTADEERRRSPQMQEPCSCPGWAPPYALGCSQKIARYTSLFTLVRALRIQAGNIRYTME